MKFKLFREGLTSKYATVVGWGYTRYNPYSGSSQGKVKIIVVTSWIVSYGQDGTGLSPVQ